MLGGSQVEHAKDLGLRSVVFALRKAGKVTKSLIYENSSIVREYEAFEKKLDS